MLIAVLDSGIPMQQDGNGGWDVNDLSHPDLDDPNKIIVGPDYAPGSGPASGDGKGIKDEVGHGTHVAGIAGAESDNGTGIAGVCWNCKLMPIQVADVTGDITAASVENGLLAAALHAAFNDYKLVINASFRIPDVQRVEDAVANLQDNDMTIVAAAGNNYGGPVEFPAAYAANYDNVIAVSSTDEDDDISDFSSTGPEVVIAAPGGHGGSSSANDIFSTTPNYSFTLEQGGVDRNYGYLAGTSMAAPHVAGAVGLMLSDFPDRSPAEIRSILESKAKDLGTTGFDEQFGHGRLNLYGAMLPLRVNVHGPSVVNEGEENTWTTSVLGGRSPYTYSWRARVDASEPWYGIPCYSSTCTYAFNDEKYGDQVSGIQVFVNDSRGLSASDQMDVIVNESGGPPPGPCPDAPNVICPPPRSLAGNAPGTPAEFSLGESYPNPVQAGQSVTIPFALPEASEVTLVVYDMLGREVRRVENGTVGAGRPQARVGTAGLSSGTYVYRLRAGDQFTGTGKLVLVK